ncbi:MAG: RNase adapter RapZ [Clostridia bacterium]|nr:RNase adapter RapZ [Clostridia bacterium]
MELLIVTGLSGAGKSQCANALEDMGFYCVDNVPPTIIPSFVNLGVTAKNQLSKMALVTDTRGGDMFHSINDVLNSLDNQGTDYKILFLDARNEVLVRRYKENRRKHPLNKDGQISINEAVETERKTLEQIRNRSDYIIDTSLISNAQLKEKLSALVYGDTHSALKIQCKSFGFKYGADGEDDLIFDVRCLPNPFYDEVLKEKTGIDDDVRNYVLSTEEAHKFLDKLTDFIDYSVPLYAKEGKSQLNLAFGCTGGKHRSVTFAEIIGKALKDKNYDCSIVHRDILKR